MAVHKRVHLHQTEEKKQKLLETIESLRDRRIGEKSSVDMLVEFEPGARVGLTFITMQDELSELLGRKVDLNTPACLSPYFRKEALDEAEVLYDAA